MIKLELESESLKNISTEVSEFNHTILNKIAEQLPERVKEVFEGEGLRDGEGTKWKPTTLIAREARRSGKVDNPTLVDTGALRDSIDAYVESIPEGYVIILGSDKDYASLHQSGGVIQVAGKTYTLPQREFLFFTSKDEELIDKIWGETKL